MEVCRVDPGCLVFVDEMGTHTSLAPLYAYAPVGERAFFKVPRNRDKNHAAYEPSSRRDGTFYGCGRADYRPSLRNLREAFAGPCPRPGQVVVIDNLGAHRPKRIRELIKERGCELLYLPAYSPDLNPIEEALSKVEHLLRKLAAPPRRP